MREHRAPALTRAVTAGVVPVIGGSNWGTDVNVQGFQRGPDIDSNARFNMIGPNYLKTLGIPPHRRTRVHPGERAQRAEGRHVNEAFAKKFKLGSDVVGRLMTDDGGQLDTLIIGLVKDAKYSEVKDVVPPLFLVPYKQTERIRSITFYVKTAGDPPQLVAQVPRWSPSSPASSPPIGRRRWIR